LKNLEEAKKTLQQEKRKEGYENMLKELKSKMPVVIYENALENVVRSGSGQAN